MFAPPATVAIDGQPIRHDQQQTTDAVLLEIRELDDVQHGFVHEVLSVGELPVPLVKCGDCTLAVWQQERPATGQELWRQAATSSLSPPPRLRSHLLPEGGRFP